MPGLGTLWIDFRSASLDKKNQKIDPPQGYLQYSSDYNKTYDTSIQLTQMGIHQHTVEKFIQFVQREIITSGKITINNIGNLSVSENSQKIFLPAKQEAFNKFHDLPILDAIPVKKFDVSPGMTELPQVKKPKTRVNLKNILNAIIVILSLLIVYRVIFYNEVPRTTGKSENVPVEDSTEIKSDTLYTGDGPLPADSEDTSSTMNYPQDDSCVYVVGSFTVKNNAVHMKNVLEQNGFQVFTSHFGKFERVGIKMVCVQDTSDKTWKHLKEKYPDLWVLDTQI